MSDPILATRVLPKGYDGYADAQVFRVIGGLHALTGGLTVFGDGAR